MVHGSFLLIALTVSGRESIVMNNSKNVDHAALLAALEPALRSTEERLFESLGKAVMEAKDPVFTTFTLDPREVGKRAWKKILFDIQQLLCKGGAPKEWTQELLEGDLRSLAVGIATAFVSDLDMTLGIAVPAVALVVKKGVNKLCAETISDAGE
jgi:hypothetical protein